MVQAGYTSDINSLFIHRTLLQQRNILSSNAKTSVRRLIPKLWLVRKCNCKYVLSLRKQGRRVDVFSPCQSQERQMPQCMCMYNPGPGFDRSAVSLVIWEIPRLAGKCLKKTRTRKSKKRVASDSTERNLSPNSRCMGWESARSPEVLPL